MLDSGTKLPENRIHLYDPVGLINDGYGGYRPSNYAVRPRRLTKPYDSFTDTNSVGLRSYDGFSTGNNGGGIRSYDLSTEDRDDGGLRFAVETDVEDESDVSTPRLWKSNSPTSPNSMNSSPLHPTSPKSINSSPLHPTSPKSSVNSSALHPASSKSLGSPLHTNNHQYHTMLPSIRTQVIAKGRRELMEMVRDLPETFYELSLKDIVEQKHDMEVRKEIGLPEEEKKPVKETTTKPKGAKNQKKSSNKVRKSESKKKMVRSKSVDNGKFLLKTSVFPILGSRKSKKSLAAASSFKIAPMPKGEPTSNGSMKGGEKEWWRRKPCISSESDNSNGLSSAGVSSRSSSNSSRSNSSNGRRSNRFLPSCCFLNGRRIRGKK